MKTKILFTIALGVFSLGVLPSCKSSSKEVPSTIPAVIEGTFVDSRDGTTYRTISINGKTWLAENLRYRLPLGNKADCISYGEVFTTANLDKIELSGNNRQGFGLAVKKAIEEGRFEIEGAPEFTYDSFDRNYLSHWRNFDSYMQYFVNIAHKPILRAIQREYLQGLREAVLRKTVDFEYVRDFGYLYSYNAAVEATPEGWHIPSDAEWQELEKALGMASDELSVQEGWRGTDQGRLLREENALGFNALLGGLRVYGKSALYGQTAYALLHQNGYYWSSTLQSEEATDSLFIIRSLSLHNPKVYRGTALTNSNKKGAYLSVRCVQD